MVFLIKDMENEILGYIVETNDIHVCTLVCKDWLKYFRERIRYLKLFGLVEPEEIRKIAGRTNLYRLKIKCTSEIRDCASAWEEIANVFPNLQELDIKYVGGPLNSISFRVYSGATMPYLINKYLLRKGRRRKKSI